MKVIIYYLKKQETVEEENVKKISFINGDLILCSQDGKPKVFSREMQVLIEVIEN